MSNVLSDEKKQQVIALGKLGWSLRSIEQATGVRRETASMYLKTAGVVVCLPGWGRRAPAKPAIQVTTDHDPSKPAMQVTTDSGPPDRSPSACEPYRELIEQGLARGRNAMALWQDLVSDHGFAGGYQTVKRFVRKLRGPQRPEAVGIILTTAGDEAQVDYGSGPLVRDPQSGKYRRTRLFVLTLGYSRKSRVWKKRKHISTAGKSVGPTRASTARPNVRSRPCSSKKNHTCCHCLWNPSATTARNSMISRRDSLPSHAFTKTFSFAFFSAGSVVICLYRG